MGCFDKLAEEMGDIQRLAWDEVWHYAEDCSAIIRNMPHHRRKRVSKALILEMLEAQGGICPLCGNMIERSMLGSSHVELGGFHVDHVIPFTKGGGYERENLQVTHPDCNLSKGDSVTLFDLVPYLERKTKDMT